MNIGHDAVNMRTVQSSQIRLSVVIPGYRTPSDIWRRCVASVLENLEQCDEVICVDDGSPEFPAVLDELVKEDSRIVVLHSGENRGQAYARNRGLDVSRGKYVAFVDSDDVVCPSTYSRTIQAIEKAGADIAVYGVRVFWHADGLCREDLLPDENLGVLTPEKLLRVHGARLFNYPWNKVYRREFLRGHNIRFRERTIPREDEIFNLDCAISSAKWIVVSCIGQVYYHGGGTSVGRYRRYNSESNQAVVDAWLRYRKAFPGADATLGNLGMASRLELCRLDWLNMWKVGSPYGLADRWRWLKAHNELGGICCFFKTWMFFICRAHFYFRPVRRWHIKRISNGRVEEVKNTCTT